MPLIIFQNEANACLPSVKIDDAVLTRRRRALRRLSKLCRSELHIVAGCPFHPRVVEGELDGERGRPIGYELIKRNQDASTKREHHYYF
jgi:hypothetical protein